MGKIPVNVDDDNIDMLCLSGHKIYGPKGVGALYVRRRNPRVRLVAQIDGGGHERGMRSGTLNVTGIVGLGEACEAVGARSSTSRDEAHALSSARAILKERIYGQPSTTSSSTAHPERTPAGQLLEPLLRLRRRGIAAHGHQATSPSRRARPARPRASSPATCCSAMDVGEELAHSSIRFGIGRTSRREEEVDYAADQRDRPNGQPKLRELSPLYEMVQEGVDLSAPSQWTGRPLDPAFTNQPTGPPLENTN